MKDWLENHKLVRRLALVWACALITMVVERVTRPDVLPDVTGGVVTVVTAVIGILTTVIGFYQWTRLKEKSRGDDPGSD